MAWSAGMLLAVLCVLNVLNLYPARAAIPLLLHLSLKVMRYGKWRAISNTTYVPI